MSACAQRAGSPKSPPGRRVRPASLAIPAAACVLLCIAAPAQAEVGAAVSIFSDARFRSYSLSNGDPVALLDLSYDHSSGAYAGASGSVVASSESGLKPLGLQLNAGYAKIVSPKLTLDAGIVHAEYSHYSRNAPGHSYTEVYAGFTHGGLSGRLSVSPHYFHSGTWTVYGEINDDFPLASRLSLDAHVGLLAPVRQSSYFNQRSEFDWRVGLTRRFGPISAQVAWTGGTALGSYRSGHDRTGNALVVGLSCIL